MQSQVGPRAHHQSTYFPLYTRPHPLSNFRTPTPNPCPKTNFNTPQFGAMSKLAVALLVAVSVLARGDFSPHIKLVGPDTAVTSDEFKCVYTVYIRTGSIWKAGTNSNISLVLAGADGHGVKITDLPSWGGLMGQNYEYFQRGNLDIFSGRGPCLAKPLCWMNLTSDGTGPHHGWYCNYVEVTVTGPHLGCEQQLFTVEQWLATDAPPYQLDAVRNNCGRATA